MSEQAKCLPECHPGIKDGHAPGCPNAPKDEMPKCLPGCRPVLGPIPQEWDGVAEMQISHATGCPRDSEPKPPLHAHPTAPKPAQKPSAEPRILAVPIDGTVEQGTGSLPSAEPLAPCGCEVFEVAGVEYGHRLACPDGKREPSAEPGEPPHQAVLGSYDRTWKRRTKGRAITPKEWAEEVIAQQEHPRCEGRLENMIGPTAELARAFLDLTDEVERLKVEARPTIGEQAYFAMADENAQLRARVESDLMNRDQTRDRLEAERDAALKRVVYLEALLTVAAVGHDKDWDDPDTDPEDCSQCQYEGMREALSEGRAILARKDKRPE